MLQPYLDQMGTINFKIFRSLSTQLPFTILLASSYYGLTCIVLCLYLCCRGVSGCLLLYFGLAPLDLRMYFGSASAQLRRSYGAATLLTRKTSQD
jgi:hypothetical protein